MNMSAAFDAASWVQRAEAIGLARVLEDAMNIYPEPQGPEVDELLAEWYGGSEEQRTLNTRAACDYVRTMRRRPDPGAGPISSTY